MTSSRRAFLQFDGIVFTGLLGSAMAVRESQACSGQTEQNRRWQVFLRELDALASEHQPWRATAEEDYVHVVVDLIKKLKAGRALLKKFDVPQRHRGPVFNELSETEIFEVKLITFDRGD